MSNHYEAIRTAISSLQASPSSHERLVEWFGANQVVGASRTQSGSLEVFLAGTAVKAVLPRVDRLLTFGEWHRSGGKPSMHASRLLLPAAGHFSQVAALICTELLRNGAEEDIGNAFARSEPLINHCISGLDLSSEIRTGLAGELLVLHAMTRSAPVATRAHVASRWDGWRRSLRDFSLGLTGIEIKTTLSDSARHTIHGIHQVSAQPHEQRLLLVSVGIQFVDVPHQNTQSIVRLIDQICGLIDSSAADVTYRTDFLEHVRLYGSEVQRGYDHSAMRESLIFAAPFEVKWVRSYDMSDPEIKVLRPGDVAGFVHVDTKSLTYSLTLPEHVHGDINPVHGLGKLAEAIQADL